MRSITAQGDTIVVYPDGSWKPFGAKGEPRPAGTRPALRQDAASEAEAPPREMTPVPQQYGGDARLPEKKPSDDRFPINPYPYQRPTDAYAHLEDPQQRYRLWYQPEQWMPVDPSEYNPSAQVVLTFLPSQGEITALLTVVPQAVDLKSLVKVVKADALTIAQNVRLVAQEMRLVNDRYLLCVRMDGSLQDQNFTYYTYYRQAEAYTIQLTVYASRAAFLSFQSQVQALLNGLVVP